MLPDNCFVSDKIEERSILMGDGSTQVLYFKHLANTAFERYAMWRRSEDEEIVASAHARLLTLGLCEPDGTAAITYERAVRIKMPVLVRLINALLEVNAIDTLESAVAAEAEQGKD